MMLNGWVINSSQGVFIETEGEKKILDKFLLKIQNEKPPRSYIQSLESSFLDPVGYNNFEIRESKEKGSKTVLVLPDIATCDECLNDIFDPSNRRYLYPFTNCTNCGPRFSIIEKLPYDRCNTTMKIFKMCDECKAEYENPLNRRFHAQPNACPKCGPHIELWDKKGKVIKKFNEAILKCAEEIKKGKILALKGLGGFHLVVHSGNDEAVKRLRNLKHREEKPLALMFPDLDSIEALCEVSESEKRLLLSPEAPIVLLNIKKQNSSVSEYIAPNNPYLGVMLPYTPLHHILMKQLGFPVVATSGNISDEPICIDENEALTRLNGIADYYLVNNRPIKRHVDDSIARIIYDREMIMRRARGYAPLPVNISRKAEPALAVGAHLKNTICLSVANNAFISQHIGDLETSEAYNAFTRVITDLQNIYDVQTDTIVSDIHPDYISTQYAKKSGKQLIQVQHHHAHILSCMAENEIDGEVLGISWDGTGYGTDGTIWGGEFLKVTGSKFERIAHLKTFKLPGGEKAIKEIWRTAQSLIQSLNLNEGLLDKIFNDINKNDLKIICQMLEKDVNSPVTSSIGRLFDAISFISGVSRYSSFEGQAAMELEFAISPDTDDYYVFGITKSDIPGETKYIIDWSPVVLEIITDKYNKKLDKDIISAKFHNSLVNMIIEITQNAELKKVVLSGGCFQNKYLIEKTITALIKNGFKPYWHQRVPTNDGGISLGQIAYLKF
jgi:hydrogenase maturation protein HypF